MNGNTGEIRDPITYIRWWLSGHALIWRGEGIIFCNPSEGFLIPPNYSMQHNTFTIYTLNQMSSPVAWHNLGDSGAHKLVHYRWPMCYVMYVMVFLTRIYVFPLGTGDITGEFKRLFITPQCVTNQRLYWGKLVLWCSLIEVFSIVPFAFNNHYHIFH